MACDYTCDLKLYEEWLKRFIECEAIYFYWKGRIALYALLKAMGIKPGDEVILPAYTCVVVPNAIIYLGAKPVYVDISESTFNIDIKNIQSSITECTKVIICQNTYGLSTDLEELNEIAKHYDLYTIEDCTHGFGGSYNGSPNGQLCNAAFFSTQWNKPFSTGIGGFAITKSQEIADNLTKLEREKSVPSIKNTLSLNILYFVKRYIINELTYWPLVKLYRVLSKYNLVLGSSNGGEISSTKMPTDFFKGFTSTQAKEGIRNLRTFPEIMKARKQNAQHYSDLLNSYGKRHVSKGLFVNHGFLKYPILVKDRELFLRLAEKSRIEVGDWFISPLHPVSSDLNQWNLNIDLFPVANFVSKHVVNLPTTPNKVDKVIDFVRKNIEQIV